MDNITLSRLLNKVNVSALSGMNKIIKYYQTILELERSKEPDIATYYTYPINLKEGNGSVMLIDLPCNANFLKAFLDNKEQTFPKDLYIGLPVFFKDKTKQYTVFCAIVDYADLKGYDPNENLLPCRLSQLSIDNRHVEELELTADTIDEIEAEIAKVKTIHELNKIVKKYLGEEAELKMELQLALSSKNIALSQISAELKNLNGDIVRKSSLLEQFLTHSVFDNLIDEISVDEIIHVTKLDESQESVVAHALSNRFSVVTGAPGTGKTQVILNIIANALVRDKSVLVASKNNKAVDNVKERFDEIDPSKYLIRFGKKDYVRTQTLPAISHIQQCLDSVKTQPDTFSILLSEYKSLIEKIRIYKAKLERIEELKRLIPEKSSKLGSAKESLTVEDGRHSSALNRIRTEFSSIVSAEGMPSSIINSQIAELKKLRNALQRKYTGGFSFWYNLFTKKKDAEIFLSKKEDLPQQVKEIFQQTERRDAIIDFKNGKDIIAECEILIKLLEQILTFLRAIEREENAYNRASRNLERLISDTQRELDECGREFETQSPNKSEYLYNIRNYKMQLANMGSPLVAAKIADIERQNNAAMKIGSYKSYLPDNIPWKDQEKVAFVCRAKEFLDVCRLISVTSLSVKSAFPMTDGLFDLLIIDEASQCDVASAIPLILRAKQVVVIGDPMQLKHITAIKKEEEDTIREYMGLSDMPFLKYVEQSLWDFSNEFIAHARDNNLSVTLENHYRCHHDIIGYSNNMFYGRFLAKPLAIKTDESWMKLPQKGIIMIPIKGNQDGEHVNVNRKEAERCILLAKEICTHKTDRDISVGIVTPFRDQADFIKSRMPDEIREKVEVNTAHGFQGDEKDVMIYSLVVTDNSPKSKINWIDYHVPNLVNVAVTRARQTLYVVCNSEYIQRTSPEYNALGYLVKYAQAKR